MKMQILILMVAILSASAGKAFDGRIYDVNNREIKTGERVAGVICDYFGEKRHPEIITHPERMVDYFKAMTPQNYKIMAWYEGEKNRQPVVLYPPFEITALPGFEEYQRTRDVSVPERAMGALVSIAVLTPMEMSGGRVVTYKGCVQVTGTLDQRSGWQRLKDSFTKK